MEATLVIVTLISLALAMAMGVITWRLLQEERLRADARVAALEQGLAESLQASPIDAPAFRRSSSDRGPTDRVGDDTDWLAQFPSSVAATTTRATAATAASGIDHMPIAHTPIDDAPIEEPASIDDTVPASATGSLFAQAQTEDEARGQSRRVVAIAAVAAVMIGAVLAVWTIGRVMAPASDARTVQTAGAPAAAPAAALELVALRHTQQDGTLTISGLVRNPHGGVPQERLTAVVFFFDGTGGFLTSTRAPLDFRTLAPGDESPFQITTPAPSGVARFRVSFRRDEGAIVPHVDRRPQDAKEASRS